ncbi:ribonuclease III [soil metagenome]
MPAHAQGIAGQVGLSFHDPALLAEALVPSSYVNEHPDEPGASNERLEFLGDAVLSLIVSEALWTQHPDEAEGILTTRRAAIVSTRGLATVARRLAIGDAILLGQGAQRSGERRRSSVLAGAYEAVVAAIYLDQGLAAARSFVLDSIRPEMEAGLTAAAVKAPKSRLQEWAYTTGGRAPGYRVLSAEGPDHDRRFMVEVALGERVLGSGHGRSRREAETAAAEAALAALALEGSIVMAETDVAGAPRGAVPPGGVG